MLMNKTIRAIVLALSLACLLLLAGCAKKAPELVTAPTEAPQKESGGGNTVLWIVLGILAVIAGLLGGILLGNSGKKEKK